MLTPVIDTIVTAETPEGIQLELRPAGIAVRFWALTLDWGIRLMILYAVGIATSLLGGMGAAVWLITIFGVEWLYPVAFELTLAGATPGKKTFGIKVVMDNGLPVTPAASFVRNLLRVADFMPLAFGFGIISILLRPDCKRLGDLAAATLVVYEHRAPRPLALSADIEPLAPVRVLSPGDRAAVIALAARVPTLTGARVDELAALAAPVSGDKGRTGPQVTRRVLGVALWLWGERR